uniref:Uncharacterized protein n=1 Tax=Panagrolaimus davidi TaxID=227884 RepID=A0A914QBA3_9BILA
MSNNKKLVRERQAPPPPPYEFEAKSDISEDDDHSNENDEVDANQEERGSLEELINEIENKYPDDEEAAAAVKENRLQRLKHKTAEEKLKTTAICVVNHIAEGLMQQPKSSTHISEDPEHCQACFSARDKFDTNASTAASNTKGGVTTAIPNYENLGPSAAAGDLTSTTGAVPEEHDMAEKVGGKSAAPCSVYMKPKKNKK